MFCPVAFPRLPVQFSVYSLPSHLPPLCLPFLQLCFLSSCPGAPGAVFCGFSTPAHLCTLKKGASNSDVASTLTLRLCVLSSPHSDVASAPTLGLWALISLRLTLSASWSDWRLDWTDPLFLLFALNHGLRPSTCD